MWYPDRFALTEQTAPTVEPVTTAEAKEHLRVEIDDDNLLIDALVTAARRICEEWTNRSFVNTTWDLTLDAFPASGGVIFLPRSPASSVSSITYTDTNGASQTLGASVYTVDTKTEPARVVEAWSQTWPTTRGVINAIAVRFVAGYGAAASNVPAQLRLAIKMLAAHWYENREATSPNAAGVSTVPFGVQALLEPYRVRSPYSW